MKQVGEKGGNRRAWKHQCQAFIRGRCAAGSGRPLDGRGLGSHITSALNGYEGRSSSESGIV